MSVKVCVFLTGLVYLFFGIAGLFPSLVYPPPPRLRYYDMTMVGPWGFLFTWLPVNLVHDILYIVIGAVALPAAVLRSTAILYARGLFFVMVMLTVVGFLPFGIAQVGGLIPLFAWNVMLHSVTAMLLYYFGFIYPLDLGGKEPPSEMLTLHG
jgi:Domain of unknown function (DUF4383)